jgi:DNA adenine methylase
MAYVGGKSTAAQHIIAILNHETLDGRPYIEPFVGYAHVLRRVHNKSNYIAADQNALLIVLLKHLQSSQSAQSAQSSQSTHPHISRDEYYSLKENPRKDPLRAAYAAFCYSYNGKFFGGYVNKIHGRDYPAERKRYYDRLAKNATFQQTRLLHVSYTHFSHVKGAVIYCDPPYANTTQYRLVQGKGIETFDSKAFWEWARRMSLHNDVFVSEYTAPKDFVCVAASKKYSTLAGRRTRRVHHTRSERLFCHTRVLRRLPFLRRRGNNGTRRKPVSYEL